MSSATSPNGIAPEPLLGPPGRVLNTTIQDFVARVTQSFVAKPGTIIVLESPYSALLLAAFLHLSVVKYL
jgi:hypothetical protein